MRSKKQFSAAHQRAFFTVHGDGPHPCHFCGNPVARGDGEHALASNALVVHHIDHNPLNNDLANLAPAHHNCHTTYHHGVKEADRLHQLEARQRSNRHRYRETFEIAAAVGRQIDGLAKRTSTEDPDGLLLLLSLEEKLADAMRVTVTGLRKSGYTDREIGQVLGGITKQSVAERWPHRATGSP